MTAPVATPAAVRAHSPGGRPSVAMGRCSLLPVIVALALFLSGCASLPGDPPPGGAPGTTAGPAAGAPEGRILGRSERFVIYQPVAADTLATIADRFLGDPTRGWVIGDFNGLAEAVADQPLAVPLVPINPAGVERDRYQTVPVLCYHRFGSGSGGGKMVVSATQFAAQLDWLAKNDYHVIPLSRLAAFLEGREALPKRSVVLTIDDGYESVYRVAWPLLRKHGFPATLFLYSDFIGSGDALTWDQLREMMSSGSIDLQAHSKSHRNLADRAGIESDARYRQALDVEAREPREVLERRLGGRVRAYAYPFGDANQAVLDALLRQHYELGLTVNPGGNGFQAQPLMLRRTMIFGDLDLAGFKSKLQVVKPTR